MPPTDFHIRDALPGDEAAVQQVVFPVLQEYGLSPDVTGPDADLLDLEAFYVQRGGIFRVVTGPGGRIVGCGGLLPVHDDTVELRKMYLLPEVRGHGLGRRLLEELIESARGAGHRRIVLDTASVLKEAISLYRRRGFQPFDNPQRVRRCDQSLFLELA